jgi:hypothetical protein
MTDHSAMRLGRKKHHGPRAPHLSKHMTMAIEPAPSMDWAKAVKAWPMLKNDTIGDCTAAGVLHLLQLWLANNGVDYTPTDAEAVALYSATSDYPKEDDGANENDVLSYWQRTGVKTPIGTDTVSFASLTPQNLNELKLAVQFFGGCYLGVDLPLTAQSQEIWDVTPAGVTGAGMPGSWGGHCVIAVAYDAQYVTVVTWGRLMKVTPAFLEVYLDEAYAVLSKDWLAKSGISPPGLNWEELERDLQTLTL